MLLLGLFLLLVTCVVPLTNGLRSEFHRQNKADVLTPRQIRVNMSCGACESFVSLMGVFVEDPDDCGPIEVLAVEYCITNQIDCTGRECLQTCPPLVAAIGPTICAIEANTTLAATQICALNFSACPIPSPPPPPRNGIPVPSDLSDTTGQKQWASWSATSGMGTFVHITDFHIDPGYIVGSNTSCGAPEGCCRSGIGGNGTSAGMWGDYKCDAPPQLIDSVVSYIRNMKPSPDFIIYTGDDPDHNIFNQTQAYNNEMIGLINQKLTGPLSSIPIFSAVGNHEVFFVNQFMGPGNDQSLYNALVKSWQFYLPLDAIRTLQYGSYYQTLVRPGLRVLSLNTNFYANGDWYTLANNYDYSSQLAWMNDTLFQAEQRHERVMLIAHQDPGSWFEQFSDTYTILIRQYQKTIIGIFYGHTHYQTLSVYVDNTTTPVTPIHVGYIGGSLTPFMQYGPGFTVYSYNRSLTSPYIVEELTQHWIDLDDVNKRPRSQPPWDVQLIASKAYNLPDLSPASWTKLARSFLQHNQSYSVFETYYNAYMKGHPGPRDQWDSVGDVACSMLSVIGYQYDVCMAGANQKPAADNDDATLSHHPSWSRARGHKSLD